MTDEELLKVFEEEKTDEMVIDELKEDLFNIYILLEMENILMGRFLHESWGMEEKFKEVSDLFSEMAEEIYNKWK